MADLYNQHLVVPIIDWKMQKRFWSNWGGRERCKIAKSSSHEEQEITFSDAVVQVIPAYSMI